MKKITVLLISILATFAVATAASARDGDVRRAGTCTGNSTSKIKLGVRDEGIEVEFEVDQNVVGALWNWTLRDNGVLVASGQARTTAPSGSFEVNRTIRNRPGSDRVVARAFNQRTGERCIATATI